MPNLTQLRIAMAGIVTDDSDGKPRTVRKKMRVKMGLYAPSVPTGITATLLARAVANPGFITVLMRCRRSSKPGNGLIITLSVSHSTPRQPVYPRLQRDLAHQPVFGLHRLSERQLPEHPERVQGD